MLGLGMLTYILRRLLSPFIFGKRNFFFGGGKLLTTRKKRIIFPFLELSPQLQCMVFVVVDGILRESNNTEVEKDYPFQ